MGQGFLIFSVIGKKVGTKGWTSVCLNDILKTDKHLHPVVTEPR